MSKASRKRPEQPTPPQPPAPRGKTPLVVGAIALVTVAIAGFVLLGKSPTEPVVAPAAASAEPVAAVTPPPQAAPAVALKPHPQKNLPPLQLPAYALGRSPEVITAAYKFAAEHPEILTYVPCFCGCERSGHRGNEDCFVKSRAANGDVAEWEPHGMECNVCLDVATQAMQMYSSGAAVRDIRAAVEKKWAGQAAQMHTHTPTPDPPK
jgi:hypothetical protein